MMDGDPCEPLEDKCAEGHHYDELGSLSDADGRGYDYIKCTRCGSLEDAWVYIRSLEERCEKAREHGGYKGNWEARK